MSTDWHLKGAHQAIAAGGVIAYPTEAVWGLGCDPWNQAAVLRLLELKQRPVHKGLILVASRWSQFEPLLEGLSDAHIARLSNTWPGPYTWLMPDPNDWVPRWIKGQHDSVALRLSDHPTIKALCGRLGQPLVSTSANRAGQSPARTSLKIKQVFGHQLDYMLPGQLGRQRQPSEVRDLLSNRLIRPA